MAGFESNRWLLNDVCRLAVENLLYAARKWGLETGIFCAIHTYGVVSTGVRMYMCL